MGRGRLERRGLRSPQNTDTGGTSRKQKNRVHGQHSPSFREAGWENPVPLELPTSSDGRVHGNSRMHKKWGARHAPHPLRVHAPTRIQPYASLRDLHRIQDRTSGGPGSPGADRSHTWTGSHGVRPRTSPAASRWDDHVAEDPLGAPAESADTAPLRRSPCAPLGSLQGPMNCTVHDTPGRGTGPDHATTASTVAPPAGAGSASGVRPFRRPDPPLQLDRTQFPFPVPTTCTPPPGATPGQGYPPSGGSQDRAPPGTPGKPGGSTGAGVCLSHGCWTGGAGGRAWRW